MFHFLEWIDRDVYTRSWLTFICVNIKSGWRNPDLSYMTSLVVCTTVFKPTLLSVFLRSFCMMRFHVCRIGGRRKVRELLNVFKFLSNEVTIVTYQPRDRRFWCKHIFSTMPQKLSNLLHDSKPLITWIRNIWTIPHTFVLTRKTFIEKHYCGENRVTYKTQQG